MAAQIAQNYLELHKIGPLFENLMASLIKDMPNEPTTYLIRMLQKADQKLRSPRATTAHDRSKSASTSALHSKYGIGVSGQPAPKRSTEEPHMALPGGGKTSAAAWSASSLTASHGRPPSADQKKRGYQKPWLSGSRTAMKTGAHVEPKKTERPASSKKKTDWNADTKTKTKDFDEMFQSKQEANTKPLSPQNAEQQQLIHYEGVKTWAAGDENTPPGNMAMQKIQSRRILGDSNDEIDLKDFEKKKGFEPMDVDSVKKAADRKTVKPNSKAAQKRMKLKALLDEEEKPANGVSDDGDESGDEAIEILEYADDLEGEGVKNAATSGSKVNKSHKHHDEGSNFQIKICARCAKVMTTTPYQGGFSDVDSEYTARPKTALSDITGSEEDFESVSQIAETRAQKWPVIKSDDDPKDTSSQVFRPADSAASVGRTEFFEANAPKRGHQTQQKLDYSSHSEVESEVGTSDMIGNNAWAVKPAESSTDLP